MLTEDTPDSNR